ncbi:hypothetical protein PHLGIDRAFT_473299 [Phlebiopsis gigantea 11061_1 CR5-6]|uniref:Uncharacterized protein n=1 Tax=Phlebiopsis gigantea (strain 11061_1 CR5-6) TaxID=745531 RepID=A0A0C3P0V6_PHLG1|nr:hypothetical protein PHLGIDRAFT_473299 [Phlebiopsis gigantea 11061_1 CR5-6]
MGYPQRFTPAAMETNRSTQGYSRRTPPYLSHRCGRGIRLRLNILTRVRNPSAVYVYDEFIDWDPSREAFHGSHGRVLYRDLLKPIGWSYRPAVIGDTVSAQPLEPLQIDLPPIISRETSDEDMDVLDEAAKYTDFEDYAQLMRSPNPSNGLEIYSELPEAGSLLISDFSL